MNIAKRLECVLLAGALRRLRLAAPRSRILISSRDKAGVSWNI